MYKTHMRLESFVHCTSTADVRLQEEKVPEDIRAYLNWEPTKERTFRGWRFLAPDQIVRNEDEDFFHIAMHRLDGAVETLSWVRDSNTWQIRTYMDNGTLHESKPRPGSLESILTQLSR